LIFNSWWVLIPNTFFPAYYPIEDLEFTLNYVDKYMRLSNVSIIKDFNMIFNSTGKVTDNFYVVGNSSFPSYLLNAKQPVLFEGGVTPAGKLYVEATKSILGQQQPRFLFITHMHWDHCGSVSYLKENFPSLIVACSEKSKQILSKENALKLMIDLNRNEEASIASASSVKPSQILHYDFRPFLVDMIVHDGQIIKLEGGDVIEVIATPGHTRDHTSYYLPEEKILIASEASGCLDSSGKIIPEFLADYDAYIASLKRLADIPAEVLCQGHRLVFIGRDEIKAFLSSSLLETELFREKIFRLFDEEQNSIERVTSRVKAEDYDTIKGVKQPEIPYMINLRAQVAHLAAKYKR
jgi:2-aminobenzoylacetyl-CoA thioesterase